MRTARPRGRAGPGPMDESAREGRACPCVTGSCAYQRALGEAAGASVLPSSRDTGCGAAASGTPTRGSVAAAPRGSGDPFQAAARRTNYRPVTATRAWRRRPFGKSRRIRHANFIDQSCEPGRGIQPSRPARRGRGSRARGLVAVQPPSRCRAASPCSTDRKGTPAVRPARNARGLRSTETARLPKSGKCVVLHRVQSARSNTP